MEWRMTKDVTRRKTDTEGDSNGERRVVTKAATWMKKKKLPMTPERILRRKASPIHGFIFIEQFEIVRSMK